MASEVEIWQCPKCGTGVDISNLSFYAAVCCPACGHTETVHTILANFRIDGILGVGGMSVVLRAHDMVLNRTAAIKVLNDTYRSQPERIARFENECSLMARVRHANVVQVYSAGWVRGQFYIAMELVNGYNLEHVVTAQDPLPPLRALDITYQVVLGLAAANRSGLLHRDMKPGNIIVTDSGQAKVLDFGLALGKREEDTEDIIWATPFYVPPETLQRKAEDVRTDIYALGMTLRYLLTGIETFPDSPHSVGELLQCKSRLPRLAVEMPQLEEILCDLVDHMTAYDPADRPENYRELLAEIGEVRVALKTQGSVSSPERRRARRRKVLLGIGATVAAGMAAAYATASLLAPEPVRRTVEPVSLPPLFDLSSYHSACSALEKGEWGAALEQWSELSLDPDCEPTMGALSALTAECLSVLLRQESDASRQRAALLRHLGKHSEASLAGDAVFSELSTVATALASHTPSPALSISQIRGMFALLLAHQLENEGKQSEADRSLKLAIQEFGESPKPWKALSELSPEMLKKMRVEAAQKLLAVARQEISAHQFSAASGHLEDYLKYTDLDRKQQDEAQVLLEACAAGRAMVSLISRKLPDRYQAGMSPQAVAEAAGVFQVGYLKEEALALFLLLNGDYDGAFRADPYRAAPSSLEPFAILMRDWKNRLDR